MGPGVYRTGNVSMELETLKKEELSKVSTLRVKELSKVNTSENIQVFKLSVCSTQGPGLGSACRAHLNPYRTNVQCYIWHKTSDGGMGASYS